MSFEAILFGTEAIAGKAATSGLFGTAAKFAAGQAFTTIATAVGGTGLLSAAAGQRQAAFFQAEVLRQQAERERQIAEREAKNFRRRQGKIAAAQRVRRAGSGVLPNEGSSLLVEDLTFDEILLGQATIKQGGQVRASRLLDEAALARLRGGAARSQGAFRSGTTLLTGFGEAFSK